MSALERCGMPALCMAILLGAVSPGPHVTTGVRAPPFTEMAPRLPAAESELIVSIGRFRVSWPQDVRALSSPVLRVTEELCFSASAVRLADYMACREGVIVALQNTCRFVTAFTPVAETRR